MNELVHDSSALRKPKVFEYLDFRIYLTDFFRWKKVTAPGFSFAVWANEAGFQSRSFIRLVMIGKRKLTSAAREKIIKTLGISNGELIYFKRLVDFNQSETHDEREKIWLELQDLIPQQKRYTVLDYYRFLSSHWTPRLQVLLTLNDIDKTPSYLASALGLKIPQIKEMLKTLDALGLAEELPDQTWRATKSEFEAPDDIGNLALLSFHKKSLQDAIAVLESSDTERGFKAAIMALTPQEFMALKQEIARFSERILKENMNDTGQGRKLYQLNLNLVPISHPLIHANERVPELTKAETCEELEGDVV